MVKLILSNYKKGTFDFVKLFTEKATLHIMIDWPQASREARKHLDV